MGERDSPRGCLTRAWRRSTRRRKRRVDDDRAAWTGHRYEDRSDGYAFNREGSGRRPLGIADFFRRNRCSPTTCRSVRVFAGAVAGVRYGGSGVSTATAVEFGRRSDLDEGVAACVAELLAARRLRHAAERTPLGAWERSRPDGRLVAIGQLLVRPRACGAAHATATPAGDRRREGGRLVVRMFGQIVSER